MGGMATKATCPARRKEDGLTCGAPALSSGYCVGHDPRAYGHGGWKAMGGRATSHAFKAARALPPILRPAMEALAEVVSRMYGLSHREGLARIAAAIVPREEIRRRDMEARVERERERLPTVEKNQAALLEEARRCRRQVWADPVVDPLRHLARFAEGLIPPLPRSPVEEAVNAWSLAGEALRAERVARASGDA
jgi:hypothetical protein